MSESPHGLPPIGLREADITSDIMPEYLSLYIRTRYGPATLSLIRVPPSEAQLSGEQRSRPRRVRLQAVCADCDHTADSGTGLVAL